MTVEKICSNVGVLSVIAIILNILKIIFIVAPILLIILLLIDFFKNVLSGQEDAVRKNLGITIKRILACVALFFVPFFTNLLVELLGGLGIDYTLCIANSKNLSQFVELEKQNQVTQNQQTTNQSQPSTDQNQNTTHPTEVTKIVLNKTAATVGETAKGNSGTASITTQLSVKKVEPSTAKEKGVKWSVIEGKQNISVNQQGLVTGKNGGTAVVRATSIDNPKVYADVKITIVHGLYENVTLLKKVTAEVLYSTKKKTIKKGTKATLLGTLNTYSGNGYKNKTYRVRLTDGTIVKIQGSYLKFHSYSIDNGYSNAVYEDYINNNHFTSQTQYLIWVNQGTQRIMLFQKKSGKWKIVEMSKTSTGDRESVNTGDRGGGTPTHFKISVKDFEAASSLGRALHMNGTGNTIHVGALPKNTRGGNPQENEPSSHGCPHISTSFRNKLYNTYNQQNKNKLIGTAAIYY